MRMSFESALVIGLTLLVVTGLSMVSSGQQTSDTLQYTGVACVYKNGELFDCSHNVITNNGKDHVKTLIGQNISTIKPGFQYLAIGNISNNQVTSNGLAQEYGPSDCGFGRQIGNWIDRGIGNSSITAVWTSTCDARGINATSLLNNTVTGINVSFANANFTGVTLQTNDQINVTYYWWVV